MFDHYLHYQKADPRRQKRIAIASIISGTMTLAGIMFVWAANKMNIVKVDPPTVSFIMVQMSMEEAPPPPPPPPPPPVVVMEQRVVAETVVASTSLNTEQLAQASSPVEGEAPRRREQAEEAPVFNDDAQTCPR